MIVDVKKKADKALNIARLEAPQKFIIDTTGITAGITDSAL